MSSSLAPVDFKDPVGVLRSMKGEFHRFGVARLWLFGSRARGGGDPDSDWDILVEFATPPDFGQFMGLKLMLEDRLGRRVDLLSRPACKPRFLDAIRAELLDVA